MIRLLSLVLVFCAMHEPLLEVLATQHHQEIVAEATMQGGSHFTVTAAEDGKWTAIVTNAATGLACIVAAGIDYSVPLIGQET